MGNYDEFEKALFSKYLQQQANEIKKYSENGYRKIHTLRFKDTIIVCPYRLRLLEPREAMTKIADEINKRYTKAIRLTMALNKAFPNKPHYVKVDSENVKKLNQEYNDYQLQNLQDKVLVSAAKMEKIVEQKNSKISGAIKNVYCDDAVNIRRSESFCRTLQADKKIEKMILSDLQKQECKLQNLKGENKRE